MDKREIPLYIHAVLEEHLKPRIQKFDYKIANSVDDTLVFELRGKGASNNFYFTVRKDGADSFSINVSPSSETSLYEFRSGLKSKSLKFYLEKWEELLNRYDDLKSPFFDDPVVSEYEDEFFTQWKILEEDADTKPFDLQRQLLIDKYLETSIQKLEAQKTKENEEEIEAVKAQATEVRQNLTRQTKNQVVRGLAKFWAMARKMGLDVLRDIFIDLASGVIQKMLMG
jgi:hypothetical protein